MVAEDWLLNDRTIFGKDRYVPSEIPGNHPWDTNCSAQMLLDGDILQKIKNDFVEIIGYQNNSLDENAHIYISGWRLDHCRILDNDPSSSDDYKTILSYIDDLSETTKIKILLWDPSIFNYEHRNKHSMLLSEVASKISKPENCSILLDSRTANFAGSHHQKLIIIRHNKLNVAYCGGVDLALTRNPIDIIDGRGDIQSDSLRSDVYGHESQLWHDQHLRLEGKCVYTLEKIFVDRWLDYSKLSWLFGKDIRVSNKDDIKSESDDHVELAPLCDVEPINDDSYSTDSDEECNCTIQPWLTMPLRDERPNDYKYAYGEFSFISGIVKACKESRELIFIIDQYFYEPSYAKFLNKLLRDNLNLYVIVILPPHSDHDKDIVATLQHIMRKKTIEILVNDDGVEDDDLVSKRVGIYSLWHFTNNVGVYCHAKTQLFDDALLVCGSTNINRRSFTNDTELSCAVYNKKLVQKHYETLCGRYLGEKYDENFNPGWGKKIFEKFKNVADNNQKYLNGESGATRPTDSIIMHDPWKEDEVKLPNDTSRHNAAYIFKPYTYIIDLLWSVIIDPTSLDDNPFKDIRPNAIIGLDDIVSKIEDSSTISRYGRLP